MLTYITQKPKARRLQDRCTCECGYKGYHGDEGCGIEMFVVTGVYRRCPCRFTGEPRRKKG